MSRLRALVVLLVSFLAAACGSGESASTSGSDANDPTCEAWCQASLAPMCAQTATLAECLAICVEDREEYPQCATEYDALLVCQTDNGFVCEGGIPRSIGDCSAQLNAVQTCRTSS